MRTITVDVGTELSITGIPSPNMFKIRTHYDKLIRLRDKYSLPLYGKVIGVSLEGTIVEILDVKRIEHIAPETLYFSRLLNTKDHYHFIDVITH
jgi:hypothetical protein